MNANLERLVAIARKDTRRIVGLMSGTSLDGLDIALCAIRGHGGDTAVQIEQFVTVPYTDDIKHEIRSVFAKRQVDFQQLCLLNAYIGRMHGQMVSDALAAWGRCAADVDIVASHGQTVMHAPRSLHGNPKFPNATLQIGDGDHVAVTSGIITLSDFRQKHIAAGGEGAPLAVYGDYFIFSKRDEHRLMLNMGGIANFTYLPGTLNAADVFTTDTGPGNTLLDAWAREAFGVPYDADGRIARAGHVDAALLSALNDHPFFAAPFPKTTGPELFNLEYVGAAATRAGQSLMQLQANDVMATLTQFSAETIAHAVVRACNPHDHYAVFMSGGGAHNPALVSALTTLLPRCTMRRTDDLGIAGDAKEALLFAVLANEALVGHITNFGNRQGVPSVSMGKVSFPQ